jgi:hypothetical protein
MKRKTGATAKKEMPMMTKRTTTATRSEGDLICFTG